MVKSTVYFLQLLFPKVGVHKRKVSLTFQWWFVTRLSSIINIPALKLWRKFKLLARETELTKTSELLKQREERFIEHGGWITFKSAYDTFFYVFFYIVSRYTTTCFIFKAKKEELVASFLLKSIKASILSAQYDQRIRWRRLNYINTSMVSALKSTRLINV